MKAAAHTKRHRELDSMLNELVADFIKHSGIPAHQATVHHLLNWSNRQKIGTDHASSEAHI